jgi:hypothetical protein
MSSRQPPLSNYWQQRRIKRHSGLAGVNDKFFLGEKLQRTVSFGIDGVSKAAVNCRKHGDDHTHLMVVGCVIDLLANCKLRHRKLLFGIIENEKLSIPANWLTSR